MTWNANYFDKVEAQTGVVFGANNQSMRIFGKGNMTLPVRVVNGQEKTLILRNVLYVPDLGENLLSVKQLVDEGGAVKFDKNKVYLKRGFIEEEIGSVKENLYRTSASDVKRTAKCCVAHDAGGEKELCIHEWHKKLGHRNYDDIKHMTKFGLKVKPCDCSDQCEACIVGKMARKKFPKKSTPATETLDIIVSDVCGWMQVESLSRKLYFVTYIDVHSKYCEVRFLRNKSDVIQETIDFVERTKTQFGKKIKVFRSDRAQEYRDSRLQEYFKREGIVTQLTVGYCPEQNGIAERKNRTLVEGARTLLNDAGLPMKFWAEAIAMMNYTTNRIIRRDAEKTPYELFHGRKPKLGDMKAFGSQAYVMIPKEKRRKLDEKAIKMMFVGYDEQ